MRIRVIEYVRQERTDERIMLVFVFLNNMKTSVPRDLIRPTGYGYSMYYEGCNWISRDGIYFKRG